MATLLFKLRGVPDDEAEDIRALLTEHDINYYETSAGSWGISLPAIWLHNHEQLQQAKDLIAGYQKTRTQHAQEEHQKLCNAGKQRTIFTLIAEAPLTWFAYLFAILFVLYVMTVPVTFLFS